jgi:uncharacterized membrane protein YciS (DUF1049 family)
VKLIKTLLFAITVIVALVMGVLFSTRNSQAFSLDLIFFQSHSMSIAIWLLLSLALGMCLSAFIYSVVLLKLKRQNTRLERRLSLISSTSKDPKVTV